MIWQDGLLLSAPLTDDTEVAGHVTADVFISVNAWDADLWAFSV